MTDASVSVMSGFFPRRERAPRRTSDRETARRTTAAQESNSAHIRTGAESRSGASTPTNTASTIIPRGIDLSVAAIDSSTRWESYESTGAFKYSNLADATEKAAALYARLSETRNYLDSAESTWDELCAARRQLHTFLNCATAPDEQLRFAAARTLGNIYSQLGDFDQAQGLFVSLCPPLPLTRAGLLELQTWHKIDALLYYVGTSAINGRDLDEVEKVARTLPWAIPNVLRTEDRRLPTLLSLIRILNCKGCHAEARHLLETYKTVSPPKYLLESDYYLQKAIAAAGEGFRDDAEAWFAHALLLASLPNGIWNRQTLHVLYDLGRACKAWREHDSALRILVICYRGYSYTLGPWHPRSIQAYKELETCKGADRAIQSLRRFDDATSSCKHRWQMAYEYGYLLTPIEVFIKPAKVICYPKLVELLEQLLDLPTLSHRARFSAKRNLAWCFLEQDKLSAASTVLYELYPMIQHVSDNEVSSSAYRALIASDEAICLSKSADIDSDFIRQRSKLVYIGLNNVTKDRSHQVKATLHRLATYGLTHFTREVVISNPSLVQETDREKLGVGAYAVVDTVKIGDNLYARKSIGGIRQQHTRDIIQAELKIIHALEHPHVVRVLLTYEERQQFSIIMHPLAESDLETYLASKVCETEREHKLMWKWMACLVNTLAYIHSKEIRHKDIKPRNVLVKGEKIYFTDFGSAHMFSEGGASTTTGRPSGHTRTFCAPEVINEESRNRSSDVFSLGCVLAEMAAWSCKIPIAEYHNSIQGTRDSTGLVFYHSAIERVRKWFEESSPLYDARPKELYQLVLKHMMRKKPDARCSAVKASRAMSRLVAVGDEECAKCDVKLWVVDDTSSQA
jgi:serine/threonine protein kinase